MAQTRTITKKKLAFLGVLDAASRTLRGVYTPGPPRQGPPQSFLVVEPWGIGDVVLSTALLQALRANYPDASITLLAKSHAQVLLTGSGLVDEIIPFDFPWTAFTGKLSPRKYVPKKFQDLIRLLRSRDFDVSLDARRDIRSNVVTYLGGVRRRIGYDFGGGAHLLTDVLPSGSQNNHKVSDWLELLAPLGKPVRESFAPALTVTEEEERTARATLGAHGLSTETPLVGLHAGASHAVRRWRPDRFATVIDQIVHDTRAQVVVFEEREGDSSQIVTRAEVPRIASDLRRFMALVAQCDMFLCSDSGPMHIAGALGVPVTALFGPQRKEWYGPRGVKDVVVQVDDMPCRPCFDACIFTTPHCMEGITPHDVVRAITAQLGKVAPLHPTGQI